MITPPLKIYDFVVPKHWVWEHPHAGPIKLKANQDEVYP